MSEIYIRVETPAGHWASETIEADIVGPFAIHESRNWRKLWTLTHVATGLTIVNDARDAYSCRTCAALLMELPIDWPNIDPKAVKSWDKELRERVDLIRFAVSSRAWA